MNFACDNCLGGLLGEAAPSPLWETGIGNWETENGVCHKGHREHKGAMCALCSLWLEDLEVWIGNWETENGKRGLPHQDLKILL